MTFLVTAKRIGQALKPIEKVWDGKTSIIQMRDAGDPNWKQMEWIGFYFEFLCRITLGKFMTFPGPKYGKVQFDGAYEVPWDFKAHAMNTSSHKVIVNDSEATANAIRDYGQVGLVIALGEAVYNDENRTFQAWREELKGGKSKYERERIQRGTWSRIRKISFDLHQIAFLRMTDKTLTECGSFQAGFRNADGSPRRRKVLIDLEKVDEETVYSIGFC